MKTLTTIAGWPSLHEESVVTGHDWDDFCTQEVICMNKRMFGKLAASMSAAWIPQDMPNHERCKKVLASYPLRLDERVKDNELLQGTKLRVEWELARRSFVAIETVSI